MTSLSHIMIGVSGGVDSAVSAYLLKKEGHHLEAVFMQNWQGDDDNCPIAEDMADAEAICDQLQIPLRVINFADDYWSSVFTHFLDEYRCGRTPNPDILCNKEIKFRAFLDYAKQQGADLIATGHYVRRTFSYPIQLLKGLDPEKDQSYFLHALNTSQLAQSVFPVGALQKTAVREIAKTLNLKNHAKKDSTGICFIGERKFKTFLANYLPAKPGSIMTLEDEIIGQHDGLMFYTIGQRQGLQIGGQKGKSESPWYVAQKDLTANILRVVQGDDHPALFKQTLTARNINWIEGIPPLSSHLHAKIRYRQADQACVMEPVDNDRYLVRFEHPQRAVTPGQSIVFYQGDICLGGGIIES